MFLSQLPNSVFHCPGAKNELSDWSWRNKFDEIVQIDWEEVAKSAFQSMDMHLDLYLRAHPNASMPKWKWEKYKKPDLLNLQTGEY